MRRAAAFFARPSVTTMYIETPRLIIRDLQPSDVDALVALWTDPDVTAFMGGPREESAVRRVLEEDARSSPQPEIDLHPVIERVSGEIIGHCGFTDKEVDGQAEIELIYLLTKACWGKGFATEAAGALKTYAFKELGLRRLVSLIDPENVASQQVARKVGMRYLRDTLRPGGRVMQVFAVHSEQ